MVAMVVFIVLMILAVVGGGYGYFGGGPNPDNRILGSGYFLLWLCVAILGYIVFSGSSGPVVVHTR